MLGHLQDPALPALAHLDQTTLDGITGTPQTRLLRARYQAGARAILHVGLGTAADAGEGAIWFFAGQKGQKLARNLPDARLHSASGALFQAFPNDHRLPQIAHFLSDATLLAPRLIGGPALGPPVLMRYRPGLSATFRWTRSDGRIFFVKQTPDADIAQQKQAVDHLATAAQGLPLAVAPVVAIDRALGLIVYQAADGQPLDQVLPGSGPRGTSAAMTQTLRALQALWSLSIVPGRMLDRTALLHRAADCARIIALLDPDCGQRAADLVAALHARPTRLRLRPIHADMKLDHVFLSGPKTTLIDTESLSLGDPDYDLAKLDARLIMAHLCGQITMGEAASARAPLIRATGRDYDWLLTCARLQCARFFAQRFDPATIPVMQQVLSPC